MQSTKYDQRWDGPSSLPYLPPSHPAIAATSASFDSVHDRGFSRSLVTGLIRLPSSFLRSFLRFFGKRRGKSSSKSPVRLCDFLREFSSLPPSSSTHPPGVDRRANHTADGGRGSRERGRTRPQTHRVDLQPSLVRGRKPSDKGEDGSVQPRFQRDSMLRKCNESRG